MSTVLEANQRAALTIRDARTEELDDVVQVLHLAYQEHIPSPMPPAHAKGWRAYWRDIGDVRGRLPCTELIVAELAGRIVGTVTMYPDGTRVEGAGWPTGWAGIRLLGVVPEARGQGIGRALTEECLDRARRHGTSVIGLHTNDWMRVARGMYERMGFQRAPEHDFRPVPDLTVLAYRLTAFW
jgi:predicted N-acetyltransferase YhbS